MGKGPSKAALLVLAAGAAAAILLFAVATPESRLGIRDPSSRPAPALSATLPDGSEGPSGSVARSGTGAGGGPETAPEGDPEGGAGPAASGSRPFGPSFKPVELPGGAIEVRGTGPIMRARIVSIHGTLASDRLERRDPLPGTAGSGWPRDPEAWIDEFGATHDPLAKAVNPTIEIGAFWTKDPGPDPLKAEKPGAFAVKTDRPTAVEEGRTTRLKGRVADAATGTGIGGASVVLFSTFYKPLLNYTHHLREVAAAASGPDGAFSIPGFNVDDFHFGSTGKVFLTVSCPGYATLTGAYLETLSAGLENDAGTVLLPAGGQTVRGRVLDLRGNPVPGALVAFTGEIYPTEYSKDQRYAFLPRFPHAVCGPDGAFEAGGISGRHWVSVHVGPDCVTSALSEFGSSGVREGLVFRVLAGGKIEGTVVDAQDRPVADAVVSGGNNSTHSYADGSFCLENVEGDRLDLDVRHHLFRTVSVPNVPVGQSAMKIALRDPLPRVVLRVLWADTLEPVVLVKITLYMGGGTGDGAIMDPVITIGDPRLSTSSGGLHALVVPEFATSAMVLAEASAFFQSVDLKSARDGQVFEVLLERAEGK